MRPVVPLPPSGLPPSPAIPGRGATVSPPNRFERLHCEPDPDAQPFDGVPEEQPHPRTEFYADQTESLLTENQSPDIPFAVGMNVYRGCEHGCAYCYARPFHEYLGWNSGLDFETKILVKHQAPALLRRELAARRWQPQLVSMSGVSDCYQPAERNFRLTRQCLEVFAEFRNPVGIVTKAFLVTRDRDLLAELARWSCVSVFVTITTLDGDLAGKLEPRAARPEHRLRAIRLLAEAGVPVGVLVAPIVPGLTDHEIPAILDAAAAAGARQSGYTVLRLPYAVKDIFSAWLDTHLPGKKARILSRVRDLRHGQLNAADWGKRFAGDGLFADQIHALFTVASRRAGMQRSMGPLSTEHFRRPGGTQLNLF
jgi:DNA repair photolyase